VSADGADTDGVPSLLTTRAPGRVWLTPDDLDAWGRQLAALLPQIHAGPPEVRAREQRELRDRHAGIGAPPPGVDRGQELRRDRAADERTRAHPR
jgi:hypothetical protein